MLPRGQLEILTVFGLGQAFILGVLIAIRDSLFVTANLSVFLCRIAVTANVLGVDALMWRRATTLVSSVFECRPRRYS